VLFVLEIRSSEDGSLKSVEEGGGRWLKRYPIYNPFPAGVDCHNRAERSSLFSNTARGGFSN